VLLLWRLCQRPAFRYVRLSTTYQTEVPDVSSCEASRSSSVRLSLPGGVRRGARGSWAITRMASWRRRRGSARKVERIETSQLAVDTHGYTDLAMALARLLGFDLCPRLREQRELAQRRLFLPRDAVVPDARANVLGTTRRPSRLTGTRWFTSLAVTVMARLGSAARGDPLYDAGVQLGKLLRTAFLTDYFVNEG
jgi:hypothetical protein